LLLAIEAGDLIEQRFQARLEIGDAGGIGLLGDADEILDQFRVLLEKRAVDGCVPLIRASPSFAASRIGSRPARCNAT